MPGRLVMDVQQPPGLGGLKRDGSHLSRQSEGPEHKRIASDAFRAKLNQTARPPDNDGGPSNALLVNGSAQNGDGDDHRLQSAQALDVVDQGETPELEHYSDVLVPFGRIVERMAQGCYFDLSEAVELLADMRINPQAQLTNGIGGTVSLDKSQESIEKKLRLLNFAQTHKDRFIKALVLSDWARNMGDMNKLIDVSMFLRKQDGSTHAAADGIYRLKENMIAAKMPNPNIEGALELLSTGEAPWMPDMDYIPPKPLAAQELLDTLSDMDFALSVRFNLDEELPSQFRRYAIADGRATFSVPGEFEVDVAIADEESDSPFYFIDLRLLFSPTTSVNNDRLRNQLEARVNEILAASGLQGCYDFLHNFVLTHKLNVLRCQALELTRGKWIDNVDVQGVHRSVIVQYWKHQPGGKNWIELGISSGTQKNGAEQRSPSQLTSRWFRRGQEVIDHDLTFDFGNLSMEAILNQAIAKHASGRLTALSLDLATLAPQGSSFSQDLVSSSSDATDCSLRLAGYNVTMTLTTDPIRGVYVVQPQSKFARDIERRLNRDHLADSASMVRYNFCRLQLSHIESCALAVGLSPCDVTSHKGPASSILREAVAYVSFQRSFWGPDCAATVTCDLAGGPVWHLSTIEGPKDARVIGHVRKLHLGDISTQRVDANLLLQIERTVMETLSVLQSNSELADLASSKSSTLKDEAGEASREALRNDLGHASMTWPRYLNPNHLLTANREHTGSQVFHNAGSCNMELPLSNAEETGLIYCYRTKLHSETPARTIDLLHRSLSNSQTAQVGKKGEVQIRWRSQPGSNIYGHLQTTLSAMSTLCSYVAALARSHCAVLHLGLDGIKLGYASDLTCTVFINSLTYATKLEFGVLSGSEPQAENPHQRIRKQLERLFLTSDPFAASAAPTADKLTDLVHVLRATLPLLRAAEVFESKHPVACATLHCHSAIDYRLIYRKPLSAMSFSIVGQAKNKKLSWVVKPSNVSGLSDQKRGDLATVFKSKGDGWEGAKTRSIATVPGIANCLARIDELVRAMDSLEASQGSSQTIQRQGAQPNQRSANQQSQSAVQQGKGGQVSQKGQSQGRGQEVVVLD